jgi:nicotinamide riboside transporter PnuC
MNFDMKYVVGILLLVIAVALFWTARIDLPTFLGLMAAALAVMGYTAYQARKVDKTIP